MLNQNDVDRLVSRVSDGYSMWDEARIDVAAVARRARVEHAAETLVQLGHGQLAGELLRLERDGRPRITNPAEFPLSA